MFKYRLLMALALYLLTASSAPCLAAPVGPNQVRYYSGANYSGQSVTLLLETDMLQRLVPQMGDLAAKVRSIEVGSKVGVFLFPGENFNGAYSAVLAGKADLGDWNNRARSLIVVSKGKGTITGVQLSNQGRSLMQFFPLGEKGGKVHYNLEGTPLERKVDRAHLMGKDLLVSLYSRVKPTQLRQEVYLPPAVITRPSDTYMMSDYGSAGKIMAVEVEPNDHYRKSFLKPNQAEFCERPDLQTRCFKVEIKDGWRHDLFNMRGAADNGVSSILLGSDVAVMAFEKKEFNGHWTILRASQNLSPQWNNRISSAILFPKKQSQPLGIHVLTKYSKFLSGGYADIVFMPLPVIAHTVMTSWSSLREKYDDRITKITRSSQEVAFRVCQHPDFSGQCMTRPEAGKDALEWYLPVGLRLETSSLEWWEVGSFERKGRVCIDHGNNITSCTYAVLSGPGRKKGDVSTASSPPPEVGFASSPIKEAQPLESAATKAPMVGKKGFLDRIKAAPNRVRETPRPNCPPGRVWNTRLGRCAPLVSLPAY